MLRPDLSLRTPGSSSGDGNDDGVCGNAQCGGIDALVSACARLDRDDVDLEPAICLDAVHRAAQSKARHHVGRAAVHLLAANHPADLLLAVPGVPGRPLRAKTPDLARRYHVGRQLGAGGAGPKPHRALPHLRCDRRLRHRHHLCWHHRLDGALVPGSARPRYRACGCGLRLRRLLHELPDRQHDQELGLSARAGGLGHHPRHHRRRRRARPTHAAGGLSSEGLRPRYGADRDAGETQLHAGRDATEPDLLSALHHDDDDVDQWSDGGVERRPLRQGIQGRRRAGARHGGAAAVAHALARHQRSYPPVLRLGVRPYRPREHDGARVCARGGRDPHPVRVPRPSGDVRSAHRPRVLRLGRDLLAVPGDADRHVRAALRRHQLRLPLHRPRRRLDLRRPGRGLSQADDRKLDRGVHRRRLPRRADRRPRLHGAQTDAPPALRDDELSSETAGAYSAAGAIGGGFCRDWAGGSWAVGFAWSPWPESPEETMSLLPKRQISEPRSSITMNIAGTNTSDRTVENSRPPMTASAIGERNSPPAPKASALGIMPAIMAMVVITIGRARFMPASIMASSRFLPAWIASIANSTSMMAFLVTMPISIRMPIHTGMVSCLPVKSSAPTAPPIDSGSENRMVSGCRKVPNNSTSTA